MPARPVFPPIRLGLLTTALFAAWPALAQTPPDAGQTSRELRQPEPLLPREPVPAVRIEQPPAVAPGASASFLLKDVRFSGNTAFAAETLRVLVEDALGHDADLTALHRLAERITRYYRTHGYPVARAFLPALSCPRRT